MESRWTDCWLITGQKNSGKSRLARWIFSRAALGASGVKICVDTLRDADPPNAVTFTELDQIPWEHRILRWVPPTGRKAQPAIEKLCREIYKRGSVLVWWDELDQVGSKVNAGGDFMALTLHGRHRQVGQLSCTPALTGNWTGYAKVADHLVLFDTTDPYDLDMYARRTGRPMSEIKEAQAELQPHGYTWYHRRTRTLYVMPPLAN